MPARIRGPVLLPILVFLYCAVNASDLVENWIMSGYDTVGAALFALWLVPPAASWVVGSAGKKFFEGGLVLPGLALVFSFSGTLGSLHVLGHAGLAFSIASLVPPVAFHVLWLASSVAWMPASDWFGARFFPRYADAVRVVIAIIPSIVAACSLWRKQRGAP